MESYEDVPCAIVPFFVKYFFWYKSLLLLSSFCWSSFLKILKISDSGSRVMRITPFLRPKWSIWPKQIFGGEIITIFFIYLLVPFIRQNLKKKILPADPDLRGCAILGPKMAYFPKWKCYSENLLMIPVFVIQAYLHAKN